MSFEPVFAPGEPLQYDSYLVPDARNDNPISRITYLPGAGPGLTRGRGGSIRTGLGSGVNSFNFLQVEADMSTCGGSETETVYVPCYWGSAPVIENLALESRVSGLLTTTAQMIEGQLPLLINIRLDSAPSGTVTLGFSHTFGTDVQSITWIGGNTLDGSNYNTGRDVSIVLVDDIFIEPIEVKTITFTGTGTNMSITGVQVTVSIIDNDGIIEDPPIER